MYSLMPMTIQTFQNIDIDIKLTKPCLNLKAEVNFIDLIAVANK